MKKYYIILIITVFMMNGCQNNPAIIGHRGNSSYAPENTMASVTSCWDVKADGTEIDIHLTADNQIVVIHDDNTQRTSGEKFVIADSTYDQIKKLDVGSFKSQYFKNENIPLLKDIIASVPKGKKLFIEIKCKVGIVPYLKEIIEESGKPGLEIISFNIDVLKECKKQMPNIPAYWLVGSPKDKESGEYLPYSESLIKDVLENNINGLDLHFKSLSKEYVDKVHAAGLKIYVWTVDHLEDGQLMNEIGVDGITTNYPANFLMNLK